MSAECWMCQAPLKGRGVEIDVAIADPRTLEPVKGSRVKVRRVCKRCASFLDDGDADDDRTED